MSQFFSYFALVSLLLRTSFEFLFKVNICFAIRAEFIMIIMSNTTGNRNISIRLAAMIMIMMRSTRDLVTALELLELTIEYPLVIFVTSSTL